MKNTLARNINEYIADFPEDIQLILEQIRATIKQAAPEAQETIKYAMPTFFLYGNLVHFAAFKNHIGFYPVPTAMEAFQKELSAYKRAKGSVQFPLDKPVPLQLIANMVKFRVKENLDKALKKKQVRTCKNGHHYYKNSDCPTCPICEHEGKAQDGFLLFLAAPARRALENKGITTLQQVTSWHEKEILAFHGMGKSSIPKLREVLARQGLSFKNDHGK